MAHAGTIQPPRVRIPRLGVKFEVKVEKAGGGGGDHQPEQDPRPWWRRALDAIRNFITVRVR
jgi:hypothetical protein